VYTNTEEKKQLPQSSNEVMEEFSILKFNYSYETENYDIRNNHLPLPLYGYETWYFTLREENKL
jgi:hypothetical protein